MKWQGILKDWVKQGLHVRLHYDKDADVLYISLGEPVPSYCDEEDGYILRYSLETGNLSGMTIIDAFANDCEDGVCPI